MLLNPDLRSCASCSSKAKLMYARGRGEERRGKERRGERKGRGGRRDERRGGERERERERRSEGSRDVTSLNLGAFARQQQHNGPRDRLQAWVQPVRESIHSKRSQRKL